ncbi:MAG: DNA cytosine methyltransferase [Acidobacteriia bacterium]|nr:DNA cytosine methyltransferase [Terriglobia bacterium]
MSEVGRQAEKNRGIGRNTIKNVGVRLRSSAFRDIRTWHYDGDQPIFVWASPPCTEFSKFTQPDSWHPDKKYPDLSLMLACKRIVDESNPMYWVIENVRGAVPFFEPHLGKPARIFGAFHLWGHLPPIGEIPFSRLINNGRHDHSPANRAKIPHPLSYRFAYTIERQMTLWPIL